MKTLDEIGIAHGTDKASQFSRTYAKPHNYLVHLERFVEPMRYNPIKILEIGVGGGESIRTWLEYFEQAKVYGVDIVSNTNDWNTPGKYIPDVGSRYTFACGNQGDVNFWKKFTEVTGGRWDLVIDDGSHNCADMQCSFTCLWEHVKSGGIYQIEDLSLSTDSWIQSLAGATRSGVANVDSIYFARELAILRKK